MYMFYFKLYKYSGGSSIGRTRRTPPPFLMKILHFHQKNLFYIFAILRANKAVGKMSKGYVYMSIV